FGCLNAGIAPGSVVAVVGLGPIGLMPVECAFVMGASRVFALDLLPERRSLVAKLGASPLEPGTAVESIREATRGHMADCAVEAVGAEGSINTAISLVGKGGKVSVVGVNQSMSF